MATPKELAQAARTIAKAMEEFATILGIGKLKEEPKPELVSTQEKPGAVVKKVVKPVRNTYSDDPNQLGYNPSPPLNPDPLPPPQEVKTRDDDVLITKGTIRVCYGCKKPVVMANKDVKANELGVLAFDILDKSFGWPNKIEVDKKGGVCITCPLCGNLDLWLIGGPKEKKLVSRDGSF